VLKFSVYVEMLVMLFAWWSNFCKYTKQTPTFWVNLLKTDSHIHKLLYYRVSVDLKKVSICAYTNEGLKRALNIILSFCSSKCILMYLKTFAPEKDKNMKKNFHILDGW